ncbi:DUF2946 family protein [Paraburkholderia sp. A3BS-1L]|uniref:DUF2946 family protein n=1 Tax=Paraburkholderia sp. A3BS-1L TaxID=3028375 RepID=UPI003DA7E1AB
MWLVVCLPAASQVLASRQAQSPVARLCSGSTASAGQQGQPCHHTATLARCGYCDFLGTHPALSSLTATEQPRPPSGQRALAAPAIDAVLITFTFQAGHPRDPPRRT